jgi:hypothetical protein
MPSIRTLNIDAADQCVQASELHAKVPQELSGLGYGSRLAP